MEEVELINKRKPREKHFLQKDGTIIAKVYSEDIHYLKKGKYEEIDNTLIKKRDSLVNKSNDYKIEFKNNYKESLIKISKDKYYLDFKIKDENLNKIIPKRRKISKLIGDILYSNIIDDINIEYKTFSNKVKETIILQNNKYSKLSFNLDTNLDLLEKDGEVIARDKEKIIFTIEKPFMIDSNNIRCDNINYLLEHDNNLYTLTLVLDDEWLNSKERKYPIYVDPTITNNNQNTNIYDTYIYPGDSNDDRNSRGYLKAGVEKINGQDRINRTLIKFALPTIGTGYEIVEASLNLIPYVGERVINYDHLIEVHRITSDWTESNANWNNMNDKFDSRIEDLNPFYRSTINGNTLVADPHKLYITGLVKKWYGDTPNYGIMIKSCEEVYKNDNYPMFFSKDNKVNGNPQPVFTIIYRNQNGLESYWDYKEHLFTDGSVYINTHNGNLTTVFKLGNTIGGVMPASLSLVYNTNDVILNKETFFGKGFRLSLEQVIEKVDKGFQYLDSDGTVHYFYKKESYDIDNNKEEDKFYYDEDGLNLKIEELDTNLQMTDLDKNEMIFTKVNDKYYLTQIKDTNNNKVNITLNSNNSISKVIDKYNSEINIDYNNDNIVITSSDSTTTKLNYIDNKLTSIETINGITTFNYNSNSIISSITDVNLLKLDFEYYEKSPYKVKQVKEYGINNSLGKSYNLEYSLYETTITDNNGLIELVAFNNYGNAESRSILKEQDGIDDAYSIEKTFDDKNKLTSSMIPNKYIKNYLTNTSFESDNILFTNEEGINTSFNTENIVSCLRSLKIESSIENKSIEQNIKIKKGEYYTFSGYLKNNIPVELSLSYINSNNEEVFSSEQIDDSSTFEREDVTIFYDNDAISDLKIKITLKEVGIVYLDDIQLEQGEVANSFNILENSDFKSGLTGWNCSALINDTEVNTSDYISVVDINSKIKALKVKMKHNLKTKVSKRFSIKGKKDDSYTISFWYKNEATIPYAPYVGSNISIFYEPYDNSEGHCILSKSLQVTNGSSWQHFVYTEKSIEDFKSILIKFHNVSSGNNFYVTNLSFYKNVTNGEYSYDDNGNLISIKDQSDNTNIFKYDKNNQLISMTNPLGKEFKYEYDNNKTDRVLSAITSTGISNRVIYDNNGNPITTKISKRYNKEITDGLYKIRNKGTNKYLKAELNMVLLEENECSNTIWILEKHGDNIKIKNSVQPEYTISYRNNKLVLDKEDTNNLFIIEKNTDNDNGTYYIKYNEKTEAGGTLVRYLEVDGVNVEANLFSEQTPNIEFYIELKDELFIENNAEYTEDNRFVKSVMDSNFNKVEYETDTNKGLVLSITNPNNLKTEYTYNDKKQVTEIKSGNKKVNYYYNDKNLLDKIKQGNKEYKLFYDKFLNVEKVMLGNNITLITNTYLDNNGNLLKNTYGNNQEISYEYDSFNRLKTLHKMDNDYYYKYDNNGNLSKILSNNYNEKFKYDISNRLYEYKNNNFKINYTYNLNNIVTNKKYKLDDKIHTLDNIINNNDLITKVILDNEEINYEYDKLNRVIKRNVNNYNTEYKYLTNGKRTTSLINKVINNSDVYEYKYDKLYNITDIYYNNNLIKHYEYDIYNELTKEENYDTNKIIEYTYDSSGNIIKVTTTNTNNNQITEDIYQYTNTNFEDQLTKYNNENIVYDEIGNPISIGNNITMGFINGRTLERYKDLSNNLDVKYNYDVNGIRTSKNINGIDTKYYLENSDIIYEQRGNNIIYYLYDLTGVIGLEYNGNRYYYIKNLQDDVVGILNSNNEKIVTYLYDSWGKVLSIKDSLGNEITDGNNIGIINPYRYRSYYYDTETKLYYLNSRYYNPEWKRFINEDGVLGANKDLISYNLYVYCSNNSINNFDSDGRFLKKIWEEVKGVFTGEKKMKNKSTTTNTKKTKVTIAEGSAISSDSGHNKLPTVGEPNSVVSNGKGDKRYYGEDGRVTKDIDTSHPWRHPDLENPHEHDWVWGEDGIPIRGEAHNFSNAVIETTTIIGIGYLIYRGIRMLPSLLPTFWWTIPINAGMP